MTAEELFRDLRIPYLTQGHHHCTDGYIQVKHCPECGSDNYRLGWNTEGRFFVCWTCGALPAWKVLQGFGAKPPQILELLQTKNYQQPVFRPAGKLEIPKGVGPMLPVHKRYLEGRGFDARQLESDWSLGGIGIAHSLAWRIYIPVVFQGKVVSWTTRSLNDNGRRYISARVSESLVPLKDCIYGIDNACHSLVVVEGPADAWRVGLGACALFGTSFTAAQVHLLARIPYRYLLFDNEPQAQKKARSLADQLSCFPGETTLLETDEKDPGQLKQRDILLLRKKAKLCR